MFSKVGVPIFVGVGIFLMILGGRQAGGSDGQIACYIFSVVAWVTASIWLIAMTVGVYTCQIQDFAEIKQEKQKIQLYGERRDKLVEVVKVELAKYPEYEKQIVGNIHPEILLQFPNLKSNETIVKTVEQIVRLETSVYELRANLIESQQKTFYRELSPWVIYVTPYQKFFGEQNPLVETK